MDFNHRKLLDIPSTCLSPCDPYNTTQSCTPECEVYCPDLCYVPPLPPLPPLPPINFPPGPPRNGCDNYPNDCTNRHYLSTTTTTVFLVTAFILICVRVICSKAIQDSRTRTRSQTSLPRTSHPQTSVRLANQDHGPIFKYKRGDGLIQCTDCSVCLNEFREGETLRLLPHCSHAFHTHCIDTWLESQTNCPNCRAPMVQGLALTLPTTAEIARTEVSRANVDNLGRQEESRFNTQENHAESDNVTQEISRGQEQGPDELDSKEVECSAQAQPMRRSVYYDCLPDNVESDTHELTSTNRP